MNDDKQHSLCITEKTISKCKCFPSLRQSLKKKITKLQYFRQNFKLTMSVANSTGPKDPLWKRRGVNQMTPLVLDPAIRGDITLEERYPELYEPIMVVNDSEWVQRSCWFEVHPTDQVNEGVVIDPPCYPSWYSTNTTGKVVAAHLPFTVEYLIGKAMSYGYQLDTLMQRMGSTVADYCSTLILPRRRDMYAKMKLYDGWKIIQSVLILAGEHWQGASAIYSGRCLRRMGLQVSLYLDSNAGGTREELQFLNEGGKIYRNLNDMKGLKFRVVVVALENNYSRVSKLTHFGEWLQNSVAVFLDPPVLRCSYIAALQISCGGSYNLCQRTAIFVPCHPKAYVIDKFIDIFVVNTGIPPSIHNLSGIEYFSFPLDSTRKHPSMVERVVPVDFVVKSSKVYFYENGQLLSQ